MSDEQSCEVRAVTVTHGGLRPIIPYVLLALPPIVLASRWMFPRSSAFATAFLTIFVVVFAYVARQRGAGPSTLRATADALHLGDKRIAERSEMLSGLVRPASRLGDAIVHIERNGFFEGSLDLHVSTVEDGRVLLRTLGLDATRATAGFRITARSIKEWKARVLVSRLGAAASLVIGFGMNRVFNAVGMTAPLPIVIPAIIAFVIYALSFAQFAVPAKVTVGADGVVARWIGRAQFLPIGDLVRASVVTMRRGAKVEWFVRIERKSGPAIDFVAGSGSGNMWRGDPIGPASNWVTRGAEALVERINEAIEGATKRARAVPFHASVLGRESASIEEWVTKLRAMKDETETFRHGLAFVREELWKILEDPAVEAEKRAAAAVALSPALDEEGRTRLRSAAKATVAPKLRIALEAAAAEDDERLFPALADIDALDALDRGERADERRA